jgi:hypothetical protein
MKSSSRRRSPPHKGQRGERRQQEDTQGEEKQSSLWRLEMASGVSRRTRKHSGGGLGMYPSMVRNKQHIPIF